MSLLTFCHIHYSQKLGIRLLPSLEMLNRQFYPLFCWNFPQCDHLCWSWIKKTCIRTENCYFRNNQHFDFITCLSLSHHDFKFIFCIRKRQKKILLLDGIECCNDKCFRVFEDQFFWCIYIFHWRTWNWSGVQKCSCLKQRTNISSRFNVIK